MVEAASSRDLSLELVVAPLACASGKGTQSPPPDLLMDARDSATPAVRAASSGPTNQAVARSSGSARAEQVLQLRFLDPFVRARRGTFKPTLHLHHRDRVSRCWLAHLDVEHCGRPDMLDSRVAPERTNTENRRLEKRFGLPLHPMSDAAHVSERDGADPHRHGLNRSIFAFYSPRTAIWPIN